MKSFKRVVVNNLAIGMMLCGSLLLLLTGCAEKKVPVSLVGYNHTDQLILGYSVVDEKGVSMGGLFLNPGGGDSENCCVMVPKKWRPDLKITVRWVFSADEEKNIPQSTHQVEVPIQKYYPHETAYIHVHIYPDDRVKVIVTPYGLGNPFYPLPKEEQLPWKVDQNILNNYLNPKTQLMCDYPYTKDILAWGEQWTDKPFPECTGKRRYK